MIAITQRFKHNKFQLFIVALGLLIALVIVKQTTNNAEAACSVDTSRGTVTQSFTVPAGQEGAFKFWSRMSSQTANNDSYYMEIDGGTCVLVGGINVPTSGWKWVDYKDGNESSKTTNIQLSSGTHTIKMIGAEDNVKLDKILLVKDAACVPTDMNGNPCLPDTIAPTVTVTPPTGNLSGTQAQLSATANDAGGIATVQFYINGQALTPADNQSPYTYLLNTTLYTNGSHKITAKATDMAGNSTMSPEVTVTIDNPIIDNQKPIVSITDPINGATVTAGQYTIKVNATDNVAVKQVVIKLDGQQVGSPITSAPYNANVTLTAGTHTIEAIATDTSNLTSDPKSVTITANSTPPTPKQCDFVITPAEEQGVINMKDLGIVLINWRKTVTPNTNGDCTGDGNVSGADLSILLGRFGK